MYLHVMSESFICTFVTSVGHRVTVLEPPAPVVTLAFHYKGNSSSESGKTMFDVT